MAPAACAAFAALTALPPACSSSPSAGSHNDAGLNDQATGGNGGTPGTDTTSTGGNTAPATGGSNNSLSTGGTTATGGTGASGGSSNSESMLQGLGVDTNVGARLDPSGTAIARSYNPTLRPISQLRKRSELFVGGIGFEAGTWPTNGKHHAALDWVDGATDFTPSTLNEDDSWLTLPKAMASGDLDGDGVNEVFVAYFTQTDKSGTGDMGFKIIKRSPTSGVYASTTEKTVDTVTPAEYPDATWWQQNFSVTTADLDGNGQSESIIAFNGSIYVIGDGDKDYGLLKTITYSKQGYTGYKLLRVAAGDLNNDGRDELVVVEGSIQSADQTKGSANYHIYQGILLTQVATDTLAATEAATTVTLRGANCAIGDIDSDGLNEVLFLGPATGTMYYAMMLKPTWNATAKKFDYAMVPKIQQIGDGRSTEYHAPLCAIADFDGDGKKDILAYRYIYQSLTSVTNPFTQLSDKAGAIDLYAGGSIHIATIAWRWGISMGI